ncbi:MAG: outer membrane lipoprotein chaperone LolA [Magnetococcales bacterium]|nr:outer membrane lipoprotein chaperone LolA [Magnetococcales bacterium]
MTHAVAAAPAGILARGAALLLLCLALAAPVPGAGADHREAVKKLQAFLDQLQSIEANFVQRVRDSVEGSVKENRGTFLALRPRLFVWDYQAPYQQLILSDGAWIWYYEPDLRQVTRAPTRRMEDTPAGFLITGGRIERKFRWQVFQNRTYRLPTVRLIPRGGNGQIQEISVTLDAAGKSLLGLGVKDTLGNRSEFSFQSVRINAPLDKNRFRFTPPPGVDVVTE